MASHEDLYRQMQQQDEEDAAHARSHYGVPVKPAPLPPREADANAARARYAKDIAPVIARIKKAQGSKVWRAVYKLMGHDIPNPEAVDPTEGVSVQTGKSLEEVRKIIIENPDNFSDLRKKSETARRVEAMRKTAQDLK